MQSGRVRNVLGRSDETRVADALASRERVWTFSVIWFGTPLSKR